MPSGIYKDGIGSNAIYYRIEKSKLADTEIEKYLSLSKIHHIKQLETLLNNILSSNHEINTSLKTIKTIMLIFAILAILGVIINIVVGCGAML